MHRPSGKSRRKSFTGLAVGWLAAVLVRLPARGPTPLPWLCKVQRFTDSQHASDLVALHQTCSVL